MISFLRGFVQKFLRYRCLQLASQISFFSILSIVPLLMIAVFFTADVLGDSAFIYQQVVAKILDVLPVGKNEILQNLENVIQSRFSLGAWGVGVLFFGALLLFSALEQALDIIFASEKRRNFLHSRLIGILLILGFAVLLSLPTMAGVMEKGLANFGFAFPLSDLLQGKYYFLSLLYFGFVLLVTFIPNEKVRFRYSLIGGLIFAVGITLAKRFFHWYLAGAFAQYNIIYGSLTALVLLVLWIYYVSVIFLISTLVVAHLQETRRSASGSV